MYKSAVIIVTVMALGVLAPAAHAAQPAAPKYSSCTKLLKKYPNGVAKNVKASDRAVAEGSIKPKVSPSVYKANAARLDKDKDGVVCEQVAAVAETLKEPAVSEVTYLPTGAPLLDFWMKSQRFTEKQGLVTFTLSLTLQDPRFTRTVCSQWEGDTAKWTEDLVGAMRNQLDETDATEAWLRSEIDMIVKTTCVAKGYRFYR